MNLKLWIKISQIWWQKLFVSWILGWRNYCMYAYVGMPVSLCFYVRDNMFLSLKHFWCSCPYVSMLVLIYLYAYRFYARVPMFIRFCPYVSMLKIFSMLMFIHVDARAFMFLCFNILYVHAPCFYILVPVCFYTRVHIFLCLCLYVSMLVSVYFYGRVPMFYAHTRLFQCTYPYISLLEHNQCLCPYVPMLVSLCFYARNIFYAPVPIFLCSHKFSMRKFLENIFTMDLKLCIKHHESYGGNRLWAGYSSEVL